MARLQTDPKPELLIIADDLTGACDAAVQFARVGRQPVVSLTVDPARWGSADPAPVIAVDTESRHLPPQQAAERVTAVVDAARAAGCSRFYKKIDSTLRGNIGAELETFLRAAGGRRLLLAAAYPSAGRTTKNGCQYVDGTPLDRSAFARDPLAPATESYIPSIIARQSSIEVSVITKGERDRIGESGIFVLDGECDEDLERAAELFENSDGSTLFAGTAGLSEMIARRLYRETSRPDRGCEACAGLLVINGSLNEVSLGQVEWAAEQGLPPIPLGETGRPGADPVRESALLAARLLAERKCAIVTTSREAAWSDSDTFLESVTRLAGILPECLDRTAPVALAVFGGDTAASVCAGLGIGLLRPEEEIVPGLTVCTAGRGDGARSGFGPSGSGIGPIILKSGGFGPRQVVETILNHCCIRDGGRPPSVPDSGTHIV